ncbi:LruC domain-containing protein [Bacteroides sp.]|uniref:LruC domain-containing protein n=1 Tax=Bacteroides sp. TaxID=29523 RepID=UPI003AB167D5
MNKSLFTKNVFIILSSAFMFSSCMEKDVYKGEPQNEPLKPSEVFDFSLTKEVKVNIDYGFTNDYYVLFQLYDQDPMKVVDDSWVKDETLTPIYAASTDTKGLYSGTITIPSSITEVWLYSEYLGTISPVKLAVSNGTVSYNQKEYIASLQAKTRGITSNGYKYPDDWITMPGVDWDYYGTPSNMETRLNMPSAEILYSIKKVYASANNDFIDKKHPTWTNGTENTTEIKITKDTEVSIVFAGINSSTTYKNAVGYFTYPTGTTPIKENIQKVLVFPNVTPFLDRNGERKGTLQCGNEVKLKYWNGTTFENKFPKGITIGLCMESNGFEYANITRKGYVGVCSSYKPMSYDGKQHTVALRTGNTNQTITIGFEDKDDFNYADALFCLNIAEPNAIDTGNSPELPLTDAPEKTVTTQHGILTFEDQWPSKGDYDMNDVVVMYQSTLYGQPTTNKIYKIVDEFTPIHNGGTYTCGFGYQLHKLAADKVISIQVEGSDSWEVETGQSHPTVILFDNIQNALGKKITVTTELNSVDLSSVTPPYNPFIFVNGRGREVHMVNYPPTDKADTSLFGEFDDASNPSLGVYYISRYNKDNLKLMPFCINLPNVTDFKIPAEGVKIYETYPGFVEWMNSDGEKNKEWYK